METRPSVPHSSQRFTAMSGNLEHWALPLINDEAVDEWGTEPLAN
jgi:hypothetical protein